MIRSALLFRNACLAAILGLGLAQGSAAQETTKKNQFGPRAKAAAPEEIATYGAWKVQCEKGANAEGAAEEGKKTCGMVQSVKSEKNPKAGITLIIVKAAQGEKKATMMRIMAPIGVFLPTGVAVEIDGTAQGRVGFTRCLPQICMAFAEMQEEMLGKLKKGNAANFIIYEAPGLGLPMKVSLEGFSKALDSLDNL